MAEPKIFPKVANSSRNNTRFNSTFRCLSLKVEPITQPLQPEFSEELLKAVKNWKSIPSVFPLSSVTVKETVEFIAKSTSGEIIARAKAIKDEEVVALGVVGNELIT